jgi:hypothetical protein
MYNLRIKVDDHGLVANIVYILVLERVVDHQICGTTSTAQDIQGEHQILSVDLGVCYHLRSVVKVI